MSRQSFLIRYLENGHFKTDEEILRIINWNVRNPSYQRAIRQCKYIEKLNPHVILLTELKSINGLNYFKEKLLYWGYKLFYDLPKSNDYFVLIASIFEACEMPIKADFLPHRMKMLEIKSKKFDGKFIGLYVPSRGPIERRNIDKREFQESVVKILDKLEKRGEEMKLIAGGDLNVIDPSHVPKYTVFGDWEFEFYEKFINIGLIDAFKSVNFHQDYSWFGREGDGYRFDHLFVSSDLKDKIKRCYYEHSVRENNLSDHSAMVLELEL
ncbi:MAG: hypothetical protein QXP45_02490 [Thermoproteota archaeon]